MRLEVLCVKIIRLEHTLRELRQFSSLFLPEGYIIYFLSSDIENEYEDLPNCTEIHWLSCCKTLKAFYDLASDLYNFWKSNNVMLADKNFFVFFVPCIVDNQFTTLNQQNAQYSSLVIYLIISH